MRFERVYRIQRKKVLSHTGRDVIARFLHYEVEEQVSQGMRNGASIEFNGTKLLIFTDLSPKTLAHRRTLKPLISQLQAKNISYRWGFPACLIAINQGIPSTL